MEEAIYGQSVSQLNQRPQYLYLDPKSNTYILSSKEPKQSQLQHAGQNLN